ncbi:MAG: hypothetical protein K0R67_3725 [Paenibacillus sp.]|nr:hypothetical protein [Paenibacillus sp.]
MSGQDGRKQQVKMSSEDVTGSESFISRRKLLLTLGVAGAALASGGLALAAGGTEEESKRGGSCCSTKVTQILDMACLSGLVGSSDGDQLLVLGYHPDTSVGGGRLFWNSAVARNQHDGGRFFSPTVPWTTTIADYLNGVGETSGMTLGVWERPDFIACSLYDWGGIYEGNCVASMNAALASDVVTINVPDLVTLGGHTFDCNRKIIIGGNGVAFSGVGAGFRPRDCGYIEIRDFKDIVMSTSIGDAHIFVGPAPGADIAKFIVHNCSASGGVIGVAASFESGRTIGRCEITHNDFKDQIGEDGGQGYGIQYANENATGTAIIAYNKVTRAGRHSYYVARNAGGLVELIGNVAIDHRENAVITRDNFRPAFTIARATNVKGYGNCVDGYYDGAWAIDWENEAPPNPLYAKAIEIFGSLIRRPKNILNSISFGLQSPTAEGLRGVKFIGVDYECDAVAAPLFAFTYGHDLLISNISARFKNMTGVFRLGLLTANSAADSSNHVVENVNVNVVNSASATFSVFRVQLGSNTDQIRTSIRHVEYVSDAGSSSVFNVQTYVTNPLIELIGVDDDGFVGGTPARTKFPSLPWNGQKNTDVITTPVSNITPQYFGQECYLQNNNTFWKANGLTNTNWVQIG